MQTSVNFGERMIETWLWSPLPINSVMILLRGLQLAKPDISGNVPDLRWSCKAIGKRIGWASYGDVRRVEWVQ